MLLYKTAVYFLIKGKLLSETRLGATVLLPSTPISMNSLPTNLERWPGEVQTKKRRDPIGV